MEQAEVRDDSGRLREGKGMTSRGGRIHGFVTNSDSLHYEEDTTEIRDELEQGSNAPHPMEGEIEGMKASIVPATKNSIGRSLKLRFGVP